MEAIGVEAGYLMERIDFFFQNNNMNLYIFSIENND